MVHHWAELLVAARPAEPGVWRAARACRQGQSLPAYDPRAVKGQGVTYATSPMGADHTAGYAVTANILNCGGSVDPLKKDGQIELSRNLQVATASVDSVGLCLFTAFAILDVPDALPAIVDMLNAKFGWQLTGDDVVTLGQRILSTEIDFNRRAGITQAADVLPDFFTDSCPRTTLPLTSPTKNSIRSSTGLMKRSRQQYLAAAPSDRGSGLRKFCLTVAQLVRPGWLDCFRAGRA